MIVAGVRFKRAGKVYWFHPLVPVELDNHCCGNRTRAGIKEVTVLP